MFIELTYPLAEDKREINGNRGMKIVRKSRMGPDEDAFATLRRAERKTVLF